MELRNLVPYDLCFFFRNVSVKKRYFIETTRRRKNRVKVGYLRVSTEQQHIERQQILLNEVGVEKVYLDKMSGKNLDRPQLKEMLSFVRSGDTVIVESISRFARSTRDFLKLIDILNQKQVGFVSLKEKLDTDSPYGRFAMVIFSALAQLERETLLERQREGIAVARAKGKFKGRKRIEINDYKFSQIYDQWQEGKITAVQAMNLLSLKKSTFYRRVNDYKTNERKQNKKE